MNKILKVGVVGVGGIARTHMPGWEKSDLAEVVAGSDVSEDVLKKWGAENNVNTLSTKIEDLLNKEFKGVYLQSIEKINDKARADLVEIREKISRETEEARQALLKEVDHFAEDISLRILGRAV